MKKGLKINGAIELNGIEYDEFVDKFKKFCKKNDVKFKGELENIKIAVYSKNDDVCSLEVDRKMVDDYKDFTDEDVSAVIKFIKKHEKEFIVPKKYTNNFYKILKKKLGGITISKSGLDELLNDASEMKMKDKVTTINNIRYHILSMEVTSESLPASRYAITRINKDGFMYTYSHKIRYSEEDYLK